MELQIFSQFHRRYWTLYLYCGIVIGIAFLLADYGDSVPYAQNIGRIILFPGLIGETIVSGNIHANSFFSPLIMIVASWLAWSFAIYLGIEVLVKLSQYWKAK